jgi:hypothetical protein
VGIEKELSVIKLESNDIPFSTRVIKWNDDFASIIADLSDQDLSAELIVGGNKVTLALRSISSQELLHQYKIDFNNIITGDAN